MAVRVQWPMIGGQTRDQSPTAQFGRRMNMVVITAIASLIAAAIVGLIAVFIALPFMAYAVYLAVSAVQFSEQPRSNG